MIEKMLANWIGWRAFGYWIGYGMLMTLAAAGGVAFFYTICVMILLWN